MNKKAELFELTRGYTVDSVLFLDMKLPYSEENELAEVIAVSSKFLFDKLAYIQEAYDDDLVLKANKNVKILNFRLSNLTNQKSSIQ
jgi:hypothetical protein